MKRFLTRWTIPILGLIVLSQAAEAQQSFRAKAIAQIAEQFPNSEKSPQQIYDEGLIWHTAKIFAKQFRNFELGALTGPIDKDSYRTVPGPVGSTTDSTATPMDPGSVPGGITTDDTPSVGATESDSTAHILTQRIDRRSIFYSDRTYASVM